MPGVAVAAVDLHDGACVWTVVPYRPRPSPACGDRRAVVGEDGQAEPLCCHGREAVLPVASLHPWLSQGVNLPRQPLLTPSSDGEKIPPEDAHAEEDGVGLDHGPPCVAGDTVCVDVQHAISSQSSSYKHCVSHGNNLGLQDLAGQALHSPPYNLGLGSLLQNQWKGNMIAKMYFR